MTSVRSTIEGVVVRPVERHTDHRGHFSEMYRRSGVDRDFLQLNHSRSHAGVLRGIHYHRIQSDLWQLVRGRAQVALVDLRSMIYLVTHEFDESDEYGVAWDDPILGIAWAIEEPILSERDSSNPPLDWSRLPAFS